MPCNQPIGATRQNYGPAVQEALFYNCKAQGYVAHTDTHIDDSSSSCGQRLLYLCAEQLAFFAPDVILHIRFRAEHWQLAQNALF